MKTETSLQVYQGMYAKAGCKFNQLRSAGQFNYLTLYRKIFILSTWSAFS